MSNVITNDQGHIIEDLKAKRYDTVWEKIKWVGYNIIANQEERYLIFYQVVRAFDPERNNNFIHWFRSRLSYENSYDFKGNHVIASRDLYHIMMNEYVSPTADARGSKWL